MDGAWALYEAWVKIQTGEVESALVYGFGKTSPGDLAQVQALQLDPYCVTPLWPDAVSLAALQARPAREAGSSASDLAAVGVAAGATPRTTRTPSPATSSTSCSPSRILVAAARHDCPPISDGATAMVLVAGDRARRLCERPAWIRGFDHRIDPPALGVRDLTTLASASSRREGRAPAPAGGRRRAHAPFTHQEILRAALGLGDEVRVNPSGGALAAQPADGAAWCASARRRMRIARRRGRRAVAHATSGAVPAAEPGVRAGG
jgi:acetyl-CoA acetyltransferase